MNPRICLLLVCLLLSQMGWSAKLGLLIEIGKYKGRLHLSTDRDTYWLDNTLHQQGFQVRLLANNQATDSGIRRAFANLIADCHAGDKVVIHYGGHGTQLNDDNGDETIDHLDEALVPYNAPLNGDYGDNMGAFIRDDELGAWLAQLRDRVGPNGHVLVLIDACYSGTISRGQAVVRTDNPRTDLPAPMKVDTLSGWYDVPTLRSAQSAAVVMMTACRAYESNQEVKDRENQFVGPVAYYVSEAFTQLSPAATYKALFTFLREKIETPEQHPTLEGAANARLLGGDWTLPSLVQRIRLEAQRRFRQVGGALAGYTKGSSVLVRLQLRGDNKPPQTLAGHVVEATPFESIIELETPLNADSVRLQTTLTRRAFETVKARVTLDNTGNAQQRRTLEALLRDLPLVELVANQADWLVRPANAYTDLCRAADGTLVERIVDPDDVPSRLLAHAQAECLRRLTTTSIALRATAELIPARFVPGSETLKTRLPVEKRAGWPIVRLDQQALLTIRNTGTLPAYVSLIDIQPDAQISVVLPNIRYSAESLRLLPGQSVTLPMLQITPPLGLETYKLLLTQTPVDLLGLVQRRGEGVPATAHPLAQLLASRMRGNTAPPLALAEAALLDFRCWIDIPKKP